MFASVSGYFFRSTAIGQTKRAGFLRLHVWPKSHPLRFPTIQFNRDQANSRPGAHEVVQVDWILLNPELSCRKRGEDPRVPSSSLDGEATSRPHIKQRVTEYWIVDAGCESQVNICTDAPSVRRRKRERDSTLNFYLGKKVGRDRAKSPLFDCRQLDGRRGSVDRSASLHG